MSALRLLIKNPGLFEDDFMHSRQRSAKEVFADIPEARRQVAYHKQVFSMVFRPAEISCLDLSCSNCTGIDELHFAADCSLDHVGKHRIMGASKDQRIDPCTDDWS